MVNQLTNTQILVQFTNFRAWAALRPDALIKPKPVKKPVRFVKLTVFRLSLPTPDRETVKETPYGMALFTQ